MKKHIGQTWAVNCTEAEDAELVAAVAEVVAALDLGWTSGGPGELGFTSGGPRVDLGWTWGGPGVDLGARFDLGWTSGKPGVDLGARFDLARFDFENMGWKVLKHDMSALATSVTRATEVFVTTDQPWTFLMVSIC